MNQVKKILIIEDEEDFARMVKLRLSIEGYDSEIVGDTESGIGAIMNNNYNLIILDLMMPGGGGFVLLDQIRKKPEKLSIPVVILTGKTLNAEVKAMIGNYQVSSVFSKPYDPIKFVKMINTLALESA